jgi:hypothetical protein
VADSQVSIIVAAQETASAVLQKVSDALHSTQKAADDLTSGLSKNQQAWDAYSVKTGQLGSSLDQFIAKEQAAKQATTDVADANDKAAASSSGLFTQFAAAGLAVNAITAGFQDLKQTLTDSVQAATAYQNAISGLNSYAQAFGVSTNDANNAVKSLTSDGLLPLTTTANALKNLLSTGIGLDKSVQLLDAFKDRAAFGRAATVDFGDAVNNLSEFFKTGRSQLGDLNGITTNYNQLVEEGAAQMGVNVNQLSQAGTYQAAYLGILQDSAAAQGNAAQYADTYAGAQSRLANQINQTQIALGSALQPAIQLVEQSFSGLMDTIMGAGIGTQEFKADLLTLAAAGTEAINVLIGAVEVLGAALYSVVTFNPQPVLDAINDAGQRITDTAANWQQGITNISDDANNQRQDDLNKALATANDSYTQANDKLNQQIARENENFADAMQQRTQQFQQSMTDMIIAHRDKADSLKNDIASENEAYTKQTEELQQQLNDKMANLDDAHAQKVADITDKITEEKNKGLIVDGVVYAEANQKKLDDLQKQLDQENAKYDKSVTDAKTKYAKDAANAKEAHDKKLTQLQESLAAETKVLQAHVAEVAAVGNKQKDDDITRLQQQYAQENAQAAKQHQQRLTDLRSQGAQQGTALASAIQNAYNGYTKAIAPQQQSLAYQQGQAMSDAMWKGFQQRATEFFNGLPSWIDRQTGAISGGKAILDYAKNLTIASIPGFGQISTIAKALHIPGFAEGGYTGAGGTNDVAGVVHRGEYVLPRSMVNQSTGMPKSNVAGSAPQIHIGTVNNYTQADLSSFARDIGFQLALRT